MDATFSRRAVAFGLRVRAWSRSFTAEVKKRCETYKTTTVKPVGGG